MDDMLDDGNVNWTCFHRRASGTRRERICAERGSGIRPTGTCMTRTLRGTALDRSSQSCMVLMMLKSWSGVDVPDPVISISKVDHSFGVL